MILRRDVLRYSTRAGQRFRRTHLRSICALIVAAFAINAVESADDSGSKRNDSAANALLFQSKVQPALLAKCTKCHGAKTRKGELDLSSIPGIRKGGESGPIVVPGKATESALYERTHSGEMPPDGKDPLSAEELDALLKWIDGGAAFGEEAGQGNQPELTQHDVIPILLLRCTICHGARKQEGALDLRSRASMLKGGKSGPAIQPGKPEESLLLKRIQAEEMPPRQKLIEATVKPMEADEIEKVSRWIGLGAPEAPADSSDATNKQNELISPEDRDFWCFQSPKLSPIPDVRSADRVRNPIDAFVLQKLETKGASLSPAADRLTLLRRVSFDLTGLPPEPGEINRFLADELPGAYERLIDRLLASPRYGERWGRHWLDVAGYADCEGRREQHLPRPWAWRYRDYVIRAFNADKPYDRFLLEQLAGDELADYENALEITQEIEDNLVATAFLRMAPDPTWANLTGFVPDRLDVIADAIDVLGSGVMGLTFKCARCHTHKFDPIPQRDYYAIAAIFKGAYDEHDWLKPELQTFGGAVSAGLGERNLPFVSTVERKQWQQSIKQLQDEIDALKRQPATPGTGEKIKNLEAEKRPEPKIMALWDRGATSTTYLYRRGNHLTPGDPVEPGLPAALTKVDTAFSATPPWPGAKSTGRRLAFARWLTRPDHPLTSRVMINRVWKHHFGRGLVRTLGNFGKTGERPTHPELLDWLAIELIREGYSLKAMHRLMMTSSTYMQSSKVTPELEQLDPDNRLLSRMPLRRMEAEELRDSLLLVAGQLDESRFGPADPVRVLPNGLVHTGKRRSIYVQQLRKQPATLLESFDLPAMNPNCLERSESLVAPQALQLLNDPAVQEIATQFADRVAREAGSAPLAQVRHAWQLAYGRHPNENEQTAALTALKELNSAWSQELAKSSASSPNDADRRARIAFCHTILNAAPFLYID